MDAEISFGLWLEKRRKALDLTREELAHKVGCSVSALRKIETDERHPSKQLAELLADVLDIPADEHTTFVKIARGELSAGRLKSSPPLPDLSLLQPPQTISNPIPIPPTPLIGRESELSALRQMLGDPQCRLITLVGPGGIGKTRLAIEAVHNQSSAFTHGAAFVSLASVNSVDLIIPAIANALNFRFHDSSRPKKQLLDCLRDKQVFLILDNLEHLIDGVGIVGEIIEYAPKVKVLCTSREMLNLHGEWVFEVGGLRVPETEQVEKPGDYSAVAMFVECARRTRASFTLRPENQDSIVRICRLVAGMPLAIELAGSWVQSLSCREILQEIERGIDILASSVRDLPERHRSIQAVFDHSWKLLPDGEHKVLMRLSVFRGGFNRETAEQVANANLVLLSALVAKSLVKRVDRRYGLHELAQQYAFARLQAAGEVEQTRAAHLQAFVRLAEMIEPELTQSDQTHWLSYLETEHDNFRAALRWAYDSGDIESCLRLAGALWRFWYMRSHFVEGSQWLDRALQAAGSAVPAAVRAKALNGAGYLAYYQTHFDRSIRWLEECLSMQSLLGENDIANAQATLALVIQQQPDFARAWRLYEEAIERFRRVNNEYGILRALNNQGTLAYDMGELDTAIRLFSEVVDLARKRNDKDHIATALTNLGWVAAIRGDAKAIDLCREAIAMFCEIGNKLGVAFCLEGIGAGFTLAGQPHRAVRLFGAANALRESITALPGGANARYLEALFQPARNALSEEVFASAWAEGEAMPMEKAVAYAIGFVDIINGYADADHEIKSHHMPE